MQQNGIAVKVIHRVAELLRQLLAVLARLISQHDIPTLYHHEHVICDPTRPIIEALREVTELRGLFGGGGESTLKRGQLETIKRN